MLKFRESMQGPLVVHAEYATRQAVYFDVTGPPYENVDGHARPIRIRHRLDVGKFWGIPKLFLSCSGFDLSIQIMLCHYCRSMLIDTFYGSSLLFKSYIGALRVKIV